MFDTTFFRDELVTVVHEKGMKVTRKQLEDANATFVWGELMDPHFIHGLLGRYVPFAPAHIKGFQRRRTKEFFNVTRKQGAVVPGVVLLGLTKADVKKLNEFEREGEVMRRTTCTATLGHITRRTFLYLKI